jgi:hypothetical protein
LPEFRRVGVGTFSGHWWTFLRQSGSVHGSGPASKYIIRSGLTNAGSLSFNRKAVEVKRSGSFWRTIGIFEVCHVDDEAQAGERRRDTDRRVHGANGPHAIGASPSNGRVFGNSPDFWLNVQRRTNLLGAMNSPTERKRIERARPLKAAA